MPRSEPTRETETTSATILPPPLVPAPLVPDGVDLRDFPFTPLFRARLFSSAFHANVTDGEWRAGVTLWLKSWDQVPAGSLPADDVALCRLAELGRDLKSWRKIRSGALTGWTPCSDGRLYHKVVAEGVLTAWDGKLKQRWRNECARLRKTRNRADGYVEAPSFEEWRAAFEARDQAVCGLEPDMPDANAGDGGAMVRVPDGDGYAGGTHDNAPKRKREGQGEREGKGEGKREGEEKREKGGETATTTASRTDAACFAADTAAGSAGASAAAAAGVGGGEADDLDLNDAKRDEAVLDAVKVEQEACSPGAGPTSSSVVPSAGPGPTAAAPASTSSDQAAPADRSALLRAASTLRARLEAELNLPIPIITAPILSWLQAGASAELIEATIADVMAQKPGFTPVSIAYFSPAIVRAQAAAQAVAKAAAAAPAPGPQLRASSTSPPMAVARFDPISFINSGAASRRP